jgi:hypothetical protein
MSSLDQKFNCKSRLTTGETSVPKEVGLPIFSFKGLNVFVSFLLYN